MWSVWQGRIRITQVFPLRIGVDLMGSDCSPTSLFEAVDRAVRQFPDIHLIPFLTQSALDDIAAAYSARGCSCPSVAFDIASLFIEMSDEPLQVIRRKKDSTLIRGLAQLKEGRIDAFVTSGNTGALVAGATLMLPLFPGVKRPALLAALPSDRGDVALIDVGGNVSCKASQLVQFALMGAAYQMCRKQIKTPRIGLLNIGVESKKGALEERTAYEMLQEMAVQGKIDFVGNVEGRHLFEGVADVIATNGFSGNVVLKTSEGVSQFILQKLAKVLAAVVPEESQGIIAKMKAQLDYEEYFGALLCGVGGVVIKCHGESSSKGLFNAICAAIEFTREQLIPKIQSRLST